MFSHIFQRFNLSFHPGITSSWQYFPFDEHTLGDLYNDATYSKEDFFGPYALDGFQKNVEIVSTMHFSYGRCYTLLPKVTTFKPVKISFRIIILNFTNF